jgi:pimeloyl-ACP methyl ester carboxylesterase
MGSADQPTRRLTPREPPDRYPLSVMSERDVRLEDGRTLRVHDAGSTGSEAFTVFWHHGTPQTGALLEPLVSAAAERNIRLLSYARPSYGGSTPHPGRDIASAASEVAQIADASGIERFAVMGASSGGSYALACAALLPDRVMGAVGIAAVAPYTEDFDWFDGMASPSALQAARQGREARARYAATEVFDPEVFTPADWAALSGTWSSLGADAGRAGEAGSDGSIDDDVALASPWGVDLAQVSAPVLLVQGGRDRMIPPAHATWLLHHVPGSELWLRPGDGHISVLRACPVAMDWLRANVEQPPSP